MKISLCIVEDYLLNRVNLRHTLKQYEELELVGEFETAEECISAIKTTPCDIVLMDLGLPFMNGIEATKIIKEEHPGTKIIVMTSHDSEDTVLAAISAGANAYCLKDTDESHLIEIIKMVNDGALWLTPQIAQVPCNNLPKPRHSKVGNLCLKECEEITLTERELSVLRLLTEGKTNPEIAKAFNISTHTAKAHVANILTKLEVDDRVQAAVKAIKSKLV